MIYAITGLTEIPSRCPECDFEGERRCDITLRPIPSCGRPSHCPLREIDETLPAQLAAAEARCAKFDRLLDANE